MRVVAVPGPSAVTAALQWSGGFGVPFTFLGFAPKEKDVRLADVCLAAKALTGHGPNATGGI
jgi:16S rRNA C1402 (ribose-2'-O) methylase RsmI